MPLVSSVGPIKDGKVQALAVSTPQALADAAPGADHRRGGLPGRRVQFLGRHARAGEDAAQVVARLNAEVVKALQTPEVQGRIAKLGAEPMPMSPEQFDAFIKEQYEDLGKIMRAAGAKPQ